MLYLWGNKIYIKYKNKMIRINDLKSVLMGSFSGGESSGKLVLDLLEDFRDTHRIIIPFANTGEENEETLIFVNKFDKYIQEKYNHSVLWLQYDGYDYGNKKHKYKEVGFETAYRSHDPIEIENKWINHPFRKMIEYFGIPNRMYKHCSRELKGEMIRRYFNYELGLKEKDYTICIGYRADEIDRLSSTQYHPLAIKGITKPMINTFWLNMPFRLELQGWEGNCKTCWKKSERKLCTIMRHAPEKFDFFDQMEREFEWYVPKRTGKRQRKSITDPLRFFRGNKTVDDIRSKSKEDFIDAADDSIEYIEGLDWSNGCEESCEAF